MDWPLQCAAELSDDQVTVLRYCAGDAGELLAALGDQRTWEHIPRVIPLDADELDSMIQAKLAEGHRMTFTVRQGGRVVGMTSVLFDPSDPEGVEVGGTQLDPVVWGAGTNARVKRLLFAAIFRHGARWILLRTDVRNTRSAAAIRKLGARDLGIHPDDRVRRDGSQRDSRLFLVERPEPA